MSGPNRLRELLERYGISPRKDLGQHFLSDPRLLDKIAAAADLSPGDCVLEIGPGPGLLTRRLAVLAGEVVAVELDGGFVALLEEELAGYDNVRIVRGDILKLSPSALGLPDGFVVVANLPYYITSAALRHLTEGSPPPRRMVLTMQKEVAERITARPGEMSLLAIGVQLYGRPSVVARISAGAFTPPPKVDSAVLRVDAHESPPVQVDDTAGLFRVARAGFSQKRKQLKNSLGAGLHLDPGEVEKAMRGAGIEPSRRPQTLSLAEWAALYESLKKY